MREVRDQRGGEGEDGRRERKREEKGKGREKERAESMGSHNVMHLIVTCLTVKLINFVTVSNNIDSWIHGKKRQLSRKECFPTIVSCGNWEPEGSAIGNLLPIISIHIPIIYPNSVDEDGCVNQYHSNMLTCPFCNQFQIKG